MTDPISLRFQKRKEETQLLLQTNPILHNLCTSLKERFSAKLTYLEVAGTVLGKLELGVPVGLYDPPKRGKRK